MIIAIEFALCQVFYLKNLSFIVTILTIPDKELNLKGKPANHSYNSINTY